MKRLILIIPLMIVVTCCSTQSEYAKTINHATIHDSPVITAMNQQIDAQQSVHEVGTVYFEYDKSFLQEQEKIKLTEISKIINAKPGPVVVEGHADHHNTDKYNVDLGMKRAVTVADYLKSCGVWEERIYLKTFGETRPAGNNFIVDEVWKNRRVSIKMFPENESADGIEAAKAYQNMFSDKSQGSGGGSMFIPVVSGVK
ncbi:MAG: OmpA family protein [Candidatus Omnitrophica bacterium]|nr:OmpA family protein [Candidatus Omnitrophota bacterium]